MATGTRKARKVRKKRLQLHILQTAHTYIFRVAENRSRDLCSWCMC